MLPQPDIHLLVFITSFCIMGMRQLASVPALHNHSVHVCLSLIPLCMCLQGLAPYPSMIQ